MYGGGKRDIEDVYVGVFDMEGKAPPTAMLIAVLLAHFVLHCVGQG